MEEGNIVGNNKGKKEDTEGEKKASLMVRGPYRRVVVNTHGNVEQNLIMETFDWASRFRCNGMSI